MVYKQGFFIYQRSFQYVHDLVDGLIQLMDSDYCYPVNIGNPEEYTIMEFADTIKSIVNPNCKIVKHPATQDDPKRRKPDIHLAKKVIDWDPKFGVIQGIKETVQYFKLNLPLE